MACPRFQKNGRILRRDAAARLQPFRICRKRRKRLLFRLFIIRGGGRIQQNDMPAFYSPFPVKPGIKGGVLTGYKIFKRPVPRILKASPDYLFDTAVMNINARSKFHNFSFSFFFCPNTAKNQYREHCVFQNLMHIFISI